MPICVLFIIRLYIALSGTDEALNPNLLAPILLIILNKIRNFMLQESTAGPVKRKSLFARQLEKQSAKQYGVKPQTKQRVQPTGGGRRPDPVAMDVVESIPPTGSQGEMLSIVIFSKNSQIPSGVSHMMKAA